MQENYWRTTATRRNLIQRVGMVHVCRRTLALLVEPVLRRVILARNRLRHPSARREHALPFNHQSLYLRGLLLRASRQCASHQGHGAKEKVLLHIHVF